MKKGIKDACSLVINEDGNFDLITPSGEKIQKIIDVRIDSELDHARIGVALATIELWVNPKNNA